MGPRKKRPKDQTAAADMAEQQLSFEQAVQQLQQIVERLESEQPSLEEAVADYQRGVQLLRHCTELLRKAEQRVALLAGVDEQGNPEVEPLCKPADSSEQPAVGRQEPLSSGNSA